MKRAPNIFFGHGSPMNVIEDNQFNKNLRELGIKFSLQNYKGIICISAHYQTDGLYFDESAHPKTIYDFYGFPKNLYELIYSAPGDPLLAQRLSNELNGKTSTNWGFDHGAWNVLWHLFPEANIPVVMMSLDYRLTFAEHFKLGERLKKYREEEYIILSSGNIVHSFKGIDFSNTNPPLKPALNFNRYVQDKIVNKNFNDLIYFEKDILEDAKFSINSAEHYLPLLYTLGATFEDEKLNIFNNDIIFSTLSMMSVYTESL